MTKEIGNSGTVDTWAANGTVVEPDGTKKDVGWQLGEQPPHEYMNWILNQLGQLINHVMQNGVPVWSANTAYLKDNIVSVGGVLYSAKIDAPAGTPPNNDWQKIAPFPAARSISVVDGELRLENDQIAPGANKIYGTDGSGQRGWLTYVSSGFETGDYKIRPTSGALAGYVRANGESIGNASSGATERANADTEALFTVLWNENSASMAVSGGRGASAAADFAANKRISLPDARNNALAFLDGMGAALTNRLNTALPAGANNRVGGTGGSQSHVLTIAQMPVHRFTTRIANAGDPLGNPKNYVASGLNVGGAFNLDLNTNYLGNDEPHNNTQPTLIGGTLYIKL